MRAATPPPVIARRNCLRRTPSFPMMAAFHRRSRSWLPRSGAPRKDLQRPGLVQLMQGNDREETGAMRVFRFLLTAMVLTVMALSLVLGTSARAETTLRIGLAEDPDILDPTLART